MDRHARSKRIFWWLGRDWFEYKVPLNEGKSLIPHDFLDADFVFDPMEYWYSYDFGRRDRRKVADFAAGAKPWLIMNMAAYGAFEDMFKRHCRAYPTRIGTEEHRMVFIDTVHDCIDMEKSRFETVDDDDRMLQDRISQVRKIILREDFDASDDIFRIDRGFALGQEIIVSDAFKTRYEQSGLTGLFFTPTDGTSMPPTRAN
jgi:hypothetical protein